MSSRVDQGLSEALTHAARSLDGRESIRERDLEEALAGALADAGATIERQHHLKLREEVWSGRLGACDLAITPLEGEPVLIEVKWGGSELWNCAWDVVKLATALAEGKAAAAYLVAGAAATKWEAEARGAELFASCDWRLEELLSRHGDDFAFWREDVATYPRRLAASWRVEAVGHSELRIGTADHQIRLARIEIADRDLARVRYRPHVDRQRSRPTLHR